MAVFGHIFFCCIFFCLPFILCCRMLSNPIWRKYAHLPLPTHTYYVRSVHLSALSLCPLKLVHATVCVESQHCLSPSGNRIQQHALQGELGLFLSQWSVDDHPVQIRWPESDDVGEDTGVSFFRPLFRVGLFCVKYGNCLTAFIGPCFFVVDGEGIRRTLWECDGIALFKVDCGVESFSI